MTIPTSSGIYEIVNLINGKRYVGSAKNLSMRRRHHFYYLNEGRHHNQHLQRSFNKYGPDEFTFRVIEFCEPENLLSREQIHVDIRSDYNIRKECVGSQLGVRHSEETRKKLSIARLGVPRGPHSEATKAKIGAGNRGKIRLPITEETRAKLRAANSNRVMLPETRAKISATLSGHSVSEEARIKISDKLSGRTLPKEHVENAAAGHRGMRRSKEARANISAGLLRSYAARKGTANGNYVSA